MAGARVLIVDDEPKIVSLVQLYLQRDGYQTLVAYDGHQALELARQKMPDLVILDLMLPGMDGLEVCRALRDDGNDVPVIMLTAKTTEQDRLIGLGLGADDYVSKPFSPRELVARVRAVLRRVNHGEGEGQPQIQFGDLTMDFVRHQVQVRGTPVPLTPKEFKLLETLIKEPGRAFSRAELLDRVFDLEYQGLERTVDVHVVNLRRKIEPDPSHPSYVQTVYGVGYRFAEDSHVA